MSLQESSWRKDANVLVLERISSCCHKVLVILPLFFSGYGVLWALLISSQPSASVRHFLLHSPPWNAVIIAVDSCGRSLTAATLSGWDGVCCGAGTWEVGQWSNCCRGPLQIPLASGNARAGYAGFWVVLRSSLPVALCGIVPWT